jgi:hypothetical protein
MKCENAILLVEKLVDGEVSADEKALVEQHVAACEDCRSHYAFVKALASASEKIALPPAPPQAYWDHLPSRIIARLHEDEHPRIWRRLFAPSMLRWGALAATVTVVVAVGLNVLREGDLAVESPTPQELGQRNQADIVEELEAPDDGVAALEPPAEPRAPTPAAAPATARDEAPRLLAPEAARSNESDSEKLGQTIARASRPRARSEAPDALKSSPEPKATSETLRIESAASSRVTETVMVEPMRSIALRESRAADPAELEYQALRGGARPGIAGRRGATIAVEDCETWRAYLERYPDTSRASDVRYELARCVLGRYETDPSDAGREVALRDVDVFLGAEPEGSRAEEIRERAAPLRDP